MIHRFDMESADNEMEMFKASVYLPKIDPRNLDIEKVFEKIQNPAILKTLPPETLLEYSALLTAYSLYITEQENKYIATVNWCESNLKFIVGKNLENAAGYFTEKDLYIRAHEENAKKIELVKITAQAKVDLLKNVSYKISYWGEVLKNLSAEKKRVNRI